MNRLNGSLDIAVIIPCYNEETAIADVVKGFQDSIPTAKIYVFDNNSKDNTLQVAIDAGAIVRRETLQGKGHVVRRMFSDVEADIYLMVDGDGTYDASAAPQLIQHLIENQLDMVTGRRVKKGQDAYRLGHQFGNRMLTGLVQQVFGNRTEDMLSGYRVFSKRFVKSFPALSKGFEIETELTIHSLELGLPVGDFDTDYFDRTEGSESKLNTFSDGFRILRTIARFVRDQRPLQFFSAISIVGIILSLALLVPVLLEYFDTGLVPRLPTMFASLSIGILASLSFVCGLILDTMVRSRIEAKRLFYLSYPSLSEALQNRSREDED